MMDFDRLLDHVAAEDALRQATTDSWRCVVQYTTADGQSHEWAISDWEAIDQEAVLDLAGRSRESIADTNAVVTEMLAQAVATQMPWILCGIWLFADAEIGEAG